MSVWDEWEQGAVRAKREEEEGVETFVCEGKVWNRVPDEAMTRPEGLGANETIDYLMRAEWTRQRPYKMQLRVAKTVSWNIPADASARIVGWRRVKAEE